MLKFSIAGLIGALVFTVSTAQVKVTQAEKVPASSITVDGHLNEVFWTSPTIGQSNKIDNTSLIVGAVDGDGDCYVTMKTFWDDQGLYIGYFFHDDVHNAPHSQYLDDANNAYDDDGLEHFIDYSYDDAASSTTLDLGLYGWQLEKGFGNQAPSEQFGGNWGGDDGSGKGWSTHVYTPDEQHDIGWHEVFTTADGVNYENEVFFAWAGTAASIMRGVGSMSVGGTIAYDVKVNDNDGAFAAEGCLSWSGMVHSPAAQDWCQIQLAGVVGVRPVSVKTAARAANMDNYVWDVMGRRMARAANASGGRMVLNRPSRNGKATRTIVWR